MNSFVFITPTFEPVVFHVKERMETIEMLSGKGTKLNAGVKTGCVYPLGKGFGAGLHLAYNVLNRL